MPSHRRFSYKLEAPKSFILLKTNSMNHSTKVEDSEKFSQHIAILYVFKNRSRFTFTVKIGILRHSNSVDHTKHQGSSDSIRTNTGTSFILFCMKYSRQGMNASGHSYEMPVGQCMHADLVLNMFRLSMNS